MIFTSLVGRIDHFFGNLILPDKTFESHVSLVLVAERRARTGPCVVVKLAWYPSRR
jgi:hypothetical protein